MRLRNTTAIIMGGLIFLAAGNSLAYRHRELIPSRRVDRSPSHSSGRSAKKQRLVFIGTVSRIYPIGAVASRKRWAVVTAVERIVSGEFSGTVFTFTVHSPARIGLRVGLAYNFEAVWRDGRYVVDDTKWMKPVEGRPRKSN